MKEEDNRCKKRYLERLAEDREAQSKIDEYLDEEDSTYEQTRRSTL